MTMHFHDATWPARDLMSEASQNPRGGHSQKRALCLREVIGHRHIQQIPALLNVFDDHLPRSITKRHPVSPDV
jgi:hypothetical protein